MFPQKKHKLGSNGLVEFDVFSEPAVSAEDRIQSMSMRAEKSSFIIGAGLLLPGVLLVDATQAASGTRKIIERALANRRPTLLFADKS